MSKTRTKREEQIRERRRVLLRGFGAGGAILKASLIERFTVCGRPGCRCLRGARHGPYLYVSVFDGQQSRQLYVPQSMAAQVRRWVQNYHELCDIVGTLSGLSVQLIRLGQRKGETPSAGRPRGKRKGR